MKHMALRSAKVSDVKASLCGDTLIVSFRLACSEIIDGLEQSKAAALTADVLKADEPHIGPDFGAHSPFTIPSTIFLASPNSIMVLSRKNSSFSTPA